MRIVIPGGTGQVGTILARHFHETGHHVTILSRSASSKKPSSVGWATVHWDGVSLGPWTECLDGADVVIHLSGRTVNCRYTTTNRQQIIDSRVIPTLLIGQAIAGLSIPPRVWLNASTATFYRDSYDKVQDEFTGELGGTEDNVPDTWRFSIDVARQWEDAFTSCNTPFTRKVILRSAMVMSPDAGGVFSVLSWLVNVGLGGTQGSGKQYVSWIHATDFARALDFIINTPSLSGVINITSPNPVPNKEFMQTLRAAWSFPFGLPANEWLLEIGAVFMRTETELILKSRRVVPGLLLKQGFQFLYPSWNETAFNLASNAPNPAKTCRWICLYIVLVVLLLYFFIK